MNLDEMQNKALEIVGKTSRSVQETLAKESTKKVIKGIIGGAIIGGLLVASNKKKK